MTKKEKLTEEEFFTKIYTKGFDGPVINQLIKLFGDGYNLSYLSTDVNVNALRTLRNKINNATKEMKDAYENGIERQYDITLFNNGTYNDKRMYNIMSLPDDGLDYSILFDPEYTNEQFTVLKTAIGLNMGPIYFSDKSVKAEIMDVCVRAMELGINLEEYYKRYDEQRLYEIFAIIKECGNPAKADEVMKYVDNTEFSYEQLKAIHNALIDGLDISRIADPKYSTQQINEVRIAHHTYLVDVSPYINENSNSVGINILATFLSKPNSEYKKILQKIEDGTKFTDAQLFMLYKSIQKNMDIDDFIEKNYSAEKIKLCMEGKIKDKSILDNNELSDLTLHLYANGFQNKLSNDYTNPADYADCEGINIFYDVEASFKERIDIPGFSDDYENFYYISKKDEIMEIRDVTDEWGTIDERFWDTSSGEFDKEIVQFADSEIFKVLSKEEEKVSNFINKYFFIEDKEDCVMATCLLNGNTTKIFGIDEQNLISHSQLIRIISKDCSDYSFEYHKYRGFEENPILKISKLFNLMDINLNEYYYLSEVFDEYGSLQDILCLDKDKVKKIKREYGERYTENDALWDLQEATKKYQNTICNHKYAITFYDSEGFIISENSHRYSMADLIELIDDFNLEFQPIGYFSSFDRCINAVNGIAPEFDNDYYDCR